MGHKAKLKRARRAVALALVKAMAERVAVAGNVTPRRSSYTPPKRDRALVERARAKVFRHDRRARSFA